jgi:hypothetical protein
MDKSIFKPLLRIHDPNGEFQTLLQANGFQVDPAQTELLMAMSKWHRMANNNEKIPPLDIRNINKFRDEHIAFLKADMQKRQMEAMAKQPGGTNPDLKVVAEEEG